MSRQSNKLDPELRGLLEEIAGDSGAHLLRAAPGRTAGILYPEGPGVSFRADLLTRAERHLLRVHRAEVGRVLHLQALVLLNEDPEFGSSLSPSITVAKNLELPSHDVLKRRTEAALEESATRELEPALELLKRCCSADGRVHPGDLLRACLRVAPTDSARIALGVDQIRLGDFKAAAGILHVVLGRRPSALLGSYAWRNLGLLELLQGRHARAAESYRQSAESHEDQIEALLGLFCAHLQTGNFDGVMNTAQEIDSMATPDHAAIRYYIETQGDALRPGGGRLTTPAQELLPRLTEQLGTTTNRIVQHVFS